MAGTLIRADVCRGCSGGGTFWRRDFQRLNDQANAAGGRQTKAEVEQPTEQTNERVEDRPQGVRSLEIMVADEKHSYETATPDGQLTGSGTKNNANA
jgi:hypothetical protein